MRKKLKFFPFCLVVMFFFHSILLLSCSTPTPAVPNGSVSSETIKVASWNIENFGISKAKDPVRMKKIASVIKEYDIVAIQEISNVREQGDPGCPRNEDACPGDKNCGMVRGALEKYLNEDLGLHYQFAFSPQVKDERYLFVYNPEKVTLQTAALMEDPEDSRPICDAKPQSTGKMVRQPFKGKFKAGGFSFILLTAHTSPEINIQELDGLDYFYRQCELEGEPDIIVLGDLNAGCKYLKQTDSIALRGPEYIWIVGDETDTTVSATDCGYDRIIYKGATVEDFTGRWGVVKDVPESVSDHYPIWAEFFTGKDSDNN